MPIVTTHPSQSPSTIWPTILKFSGIKQQLFYYKVHNSVDQKFGQNIATKTCICPAMTRAGIRLAHIARFGSAGLTGVIYNGP